MKHNTEKKSIQLFYTIIRIILHNYSNHYYKMKLNVIINKKKKKGMQKKITVISKNNTDHK